MSAPTKVAYLAEGKLYVHDAGTAGAAAAPDAKPTLVESPFVQGILDRVERNRERNDWKSQGMAWNFTPGAMMGLGGMGSAPAETRRVRFTGVTSGGGAGRLLYALDTDHVGGLFQRDLVEDHEQRLLHKQQFRARDVARRPSDGMLTLSLHKEDGTAHLAVMSAEGRGLKQVTEGDAVDEAPSWAETGETILFQSAGVGRNAAGIAVGLSPYAIQQLDLDAGKVTTLVETDDDDFLLPRQSGGALYYIRRPYVPGRGLPVSAWKVAGDVLLFPFRVARTIVHFLNVMSLMFSRKPLITSGGPPKEGPDQRYMMLWGKLIDADKLLKQKGNSSGALVPKDWRLVRRSADGTEEVLATRVVAYDVAPDGTIAYTDGSRVYLRDPGAANWRELLRGRLVERVAIVS